MENSAPSGGMRGAKPAPLEDLCTVQHPPLPLHPGCTCISVNFPAFCPVSIFW